MTETIYTTKTASEFLGVSEITLKRWVAREDMPISGQLLNPRNRVFTHSELLSFNEYLSENKHLRKAGPKFNPDAPYHRWHDAEYRRSNRHPRQQQMADALKALALDRPNSGLKREAIEAVSSFEKLDWQPQTFLEVLPAVVKVDVDAETISYHGSPVDVLDTIITITSLYTEAITK